MCLSDILLGRLTQTGTGQVSVGEGEVREIVPPDPSRIALMIGGTELGAGTYLIAWTPTGDALEDQADVGFNVQTVPLVLDARSHGDAVTRRWVGKGFGGSVRARWVTVSLKPELAPLLTDLLRKTLGVPDLPAYPGAMAPRPVIPGSDLAGGIP